MSAQKLTILHSFGDGSVINDGLYPQSLTEDADGTLYGITAAGGGVLTLIFNGFGTVYKITTSGKEAILHSFEDGSVKDDGISPESMTMSALDGKLYGVTFSGGSTFGQGVSSSGYGTAFSMTSDGTVTILHSFSDGSVENDGIRPQSGLIQASDGNFYGTTYWGGSTANLNHSFYGNGTVFRMTPDGSVTILHSFGDGTVKNDGAIPVAGVVEGSDGNFYGTTSEGESNNQGTVFRITPMGVLTILHSCGSTSQDGTYPYASLIEGKDGNFYGTTLAGGSKNIGTVFRITPSGTLIVLHSFDDGSVSLDGAIPRGKLVEGSDGNFYGTASSGGLGGGGTLFEMTPTGAVTTLHSFHDGTVQNDGWEPECGLIEGEDGAFYGTTTFGGTTYENPMKSGDGTVFRFSTGLPAAPSRLQAVAASAEASLSWSDDGAGIRYNIYRGTSPGGESAIPVATGITATNFVQRGLTVGVTYYYKVAAVNSVGQSPMSAEVYVTPLPRGRR